MTLPWVKTEILDWTRVQWGNYILDNLDLSEESIGEAFYRMLSRLRSCTGDVESARAKCRTVLELARRLHASHYQQMFTTGIETRFIQGVLHLYEGALKLQSDEPSANRCFENSLRALSSKHVRIRSMAILGQGLIEHFGGNPDQAIAYYQLSTTILDGMVRVEEREPLKRQLSKLIDTATDTLFDIDQGQASATEAGLSPHHRPAQEFTIGFLPIVGAIRAGDATPTSDEVIGHIETQSLVIEGQEYEIGRLEKKSRSSSRILLNPIDYRYIATLVQGDSMIEAGIEEGDYVILRQPLHSKPEPRNGDIVAAVIKDVDRDATLKRFKRNGNGFSLIPENPKYEQKDFGPDDPTPEICGIVVALLKKASE